MYKQIYICDRCGKEIPVCDRRNDSPFDPTFLLSRKDFCDDCMDYYKKINKEFIRRFNELREEFGILFAIKGGNHEKNN